MNLRSLFAAMALGAAVLVGCDKEKTVSVYMYSEYIAPDMPAEFEKLTGQKLKIDVYENSEEMLAKMQQGGGVNQYDCIVVSDAHVPALIKLGLVQKLDKSKLPNAGNVDAPFANPPFDPGLAYSLPYQWGTVGVVYDSTKVAAPAAGEAFDVVLNSVAEGKMISTIKAVREATQLGLKDAKDLVEGAPKTVKPALAKADAEQLKSLLEAAGAKAELMPAAATSSVSWGILFDPAKQPGAFVLMDSMRDMLGIALNYKGYDMNSVKPDEMKAAMELLKATKKRRHCLGLEGGVGGKNRVVAGEAAMAVVYNGDAVRGIGENKNLRFAVPKEGGIIWVDVMLVPAKSPNPDGGHAFMNYIMNPEAGAKLSNFNRYPTPNKAALPHITPADRAETAIYPSEETMKKLHYLTDVGDNIKLYDDAWTSVKAE